MPAFSVEDLNSA